MKRIIQTEQAPAPVGPYSQAVVHNGVLYVSGQIAIDPASGELRTRTIEEETRQVLQNLGAVLQAAGCSFADVLKCSVFVSDMNLYGRINAVYAEFFGEENAPAR
ncbi:MAG: RidA family protein, partial [Bacteroidetes bacterium]